MTHYGWIGKILQIDLTNSRVEVMDTVEYANGFIGGRGIAAKIAWDQIPPGIDAFAPENQLIFMTGPLTGTLAPTAGGRVEVCGIAPQAYPEHYTRSNMGGFWGPQLKYAGYDGLVICGKASRPVYLWIHDDDSVEIRDAADIWGLDTFETQKALLRKHGREVKTACIGPAGENLVRIAAIITGLQNAAGQGGFGAVMGAKNLKAITVRGTGSVAIANPEEFLMACKYVVELIQRKATRPPERKKPFTACSLSCNFRNCGIQVFDDIYGPVEDRTSRGAVMCASVESLARLEPWDAGFEAMQIANRMGLNVYEIVYGLGPLGGNWLERLYRAGDLTEEDLGIPVDVTLGFRSGEFWSRLISKIARKEGIGQVLAEGAARAEEVLMSEKVTSPHVGHGYVTHFDGRFSSGLPYPHWIVSALNWATDTRDPMVHGYGQELLRNWGRGKGPLPMQKISKIAKRLYGSEEAITPDSGYEWKAQPTIWHENNDCVKDSLIVCDLVFPLIFDVDSPDGFGDTGIEARLLSTATGMDIDESALRETGNRIFNLERAIQVRDGRTRGDDESVLPYFEQPDPQGIRLDSEQFGQLMDEYYTLRGWDATTGIPQKDYLHEIGLGDMAECL